MNTKETMHPDCERILFSEDCIQQRIAEVAAEVDKALPHDSVIAICVLNGAVLFFADFVRQLNHDIQFDFMSVSSYGDGTTSGALKIKKDISANVKGKDVLIVEDIIDSGRTLMLLKKLLLERGAATVQIVTLLNKPSRREVDIYSDFNCFDVGNEFIIGYGLDYAQQYRSLPYIGVLRREIYENK